MESGMSSRDHLIAERLFQAHDEAKGVAKHALRDALHSRQYWKLQLIQLVLIIAFVMAGFIVVRFVADRIPWFDRAASNTFSIVVICLAVVTWIAINRCPLTFVKVWRSAYSNHMTNVIRCMDSQDI